MSEQSSENNFTAQETQLHVSADGLRIEDSYVDIEIVVERFTEDIRKGRRPSIEEYAETYPEFAEEIRDLFPSLLILEKSAAQESLHSYSNSVTARGVEPKKVTRLKNYLIRNELGKGGMGVVYEAFDETLQRTVALKVMRIFPGKEEEAIQRFQREARMAAKLHHTNIVPVFDYDVVDDLFFYAMQLIEGVSLDQFLRAKEKEVSDATQASARNSKISKRQRERRNSTLNNNALQNEKDDAKRTEAVVDVAVRSDVDNYVQSVFQSQQPEPGVPAPSQNSLDSNVRKRAFKAASAPTPCPVPSGASESTHELDVATMLDRPKASQEEDENNKKKKRPKNVKKNDVTFGEGLPTSEKGLLSVQIASSNYYQQVCDIGIQAANALEFAHRHNVLHRDIKPSNIILDKEGVVWITDFGLAKPIDDYSLTKQARLVGSQRYLAPEVAKEYDYSPSSDLFALGLTLYELLTFTPAYDKIGEAELYRQVLNRDLVRPRKINPGVPRDLETIILKTLEASKEKRYASVGELADDLQRFLDERPIRARRSNIFERGWRLCKRNRITAALSAALVFLAIATIIMLSFTVKKEREHVRVQKANFQEAQNAINEIFQTIKGDTDLSYNLIFSPTAADYSLSKLAISDKDVDALEILLRYNQRLLEQEKLQDSTSLRETAYRYVQTGLIYKNLGQSKDSRVFEKALGLYQECLSNEKGIKIRRELIIEKAKVIATILANSPLTTFEDDILTQSNVALQELDSIGDDETQRLAIEVQYVQALSLLRLVRRPNQNLGFFNRQQYNIPEDVKNIIQEDLSGVRERLMRLKMSEEEFKPEELQMITNIYSYHALWSAIKQDVKEAKRQLDESASYVALFKSKYPENIKWSYAELTQCYVKMIVNWEILENQDNPDYQLENYNVEKEYEETKDLMLSLINKAEVAEKNPNRPLYQMGKIFVYYNVAKNEARLNRLDEAEVLLKEALVEMHNFAENNPKNTDFQFYEPIYAGLVELQIKANKLEEAKANLERMKIAFGLGEEKGYAPTTNGKEKVDRKASEQDKDRQRKRIERLQTLLDVAQREDVSH